MRRVLPVLVLALFACDSARDRGGGGGSGARADGGRTPDGGPEAGTLGDAAPPDAALDAGGGDAGPDPRDSGSTDRSTWPDAAAPDAQPLDATVPLCQQGCASNLDCPPAQGSVLTDADNYTCSGGLCRYLGCRSTAECDAAFMNSDFVCLAFNGLAPSCVRRCQAPSDCASPTPLYEADRWACTQGGCRWLGCGDAADCRQSLNDPNYACEAVAGLPFPSCVKICAAPSECGNAASPAYDADNYRCQAARCVYQGCRSALECEETYSSPGWICQ